MYKFLVVFVGIFVMLGATSGVQADQMDDAAMKAQLLSENPDRATGLDNLPPAVIDHSHQTSIGCGQSVDFNNGLPADWAVINNAPGGPVWGDLASCGESGNYTNGSGDLACVSSDLFGAADFDTELRTPSFSTLGQAIVTLTYTANYQNFANEDFLDVDVSIDGGTVWTNVLSWNEDHGAFRAPPGEDVNLDISAFVANQASVMIRWYYYDPAPDDFEWYAQVDDVALACDIPVELQLMSID